MSTDPTHSVPPNRLPESVKNQIDQWLASGLANFSLRELLSFLLSNLAVAERNAYLDRTAEDKANGFYPRGLHVGSVPLEVRVPRTRRGAFRPASLPSPYQRGYSEESQSLLMGLLASGRSLAAAKEALGKMGLSLSDHDLDQVAAGLVEELELRNSRPLDPDLLVLFVDGKYVEVKEGDRLRPACIYLAVGLGRDGRKRVLSCLPRWDRENLEDWKVVLRHLLERGLRRVLLIVQDDFSGLLPIAESLFPNAEVQLCVVHMQRNAKSHLSKPDAAEFVQRWRALKSSWDEQVGARQFEDLCERFAQNYPTFVGELRKKRSHYLAFLKYPESIRRSLSTTNVVEAINGQLEIVRRNSGGYFHSQEILKLKLGLAISTLENGRWLPAAKSYVAVLHQMNALFQARFEQAT